MAEVTFQGLTHTCKQPDCHLDSFVRTLERMQQEIFLSEGVELRVARGAEQEDLRCRQ